MGWRRFFRKSIKGFGFSQQVFCICRHADFLWKWGSVATNAMLAVNEVAESIDCKKRTVSIHRRCLLSMIITESEHTVFAKTCLCLYTGYACCQRKNKFSLDSFSERKNFHFSLKPCVRTYHKTSDFSFTWYVRTYLFHLEWKIFILSQAENKITARLSKVFLDSSGGFSFLR